MAAAICESGSSPPAVVSVIGWQRSLVVHEISTELGAESDFCHPIEKHGRCQGLGKMMAICKNLPSRDH